MNEFVAIFTREKILQQIFIELNNFTELKQSLEIVIKYVKLLTSCEAVAIRLNGADYSYNYYTYDGFSEDFIAHENDIVVRDENNNCLLDEDNNCLLQCMCGAVLNSTTDTKYEFFTEGGSFWTNSSSILLKNFSKEVIDAFKVRGHCNICGYESIALIPIRYNGNILGLLQINDKSSNKFTYELINYMEMVGIQIGIAIRNRMLYSNLLDKYNELVSEREATNGQ